MKVMAGKGEVVAQPMKDSSDLYRTDKLGDLRERFQRDGYVYIKKLLPPDRVLQARSITLSSLADLRPDVFAKGVSPLQGTAAEGTSAIGLLGHQQVARSDGVASVLEAPECFRLAAALVGEHETNIVTTSYKWLRAVARGEFTGVHSDRVFLGKGSERLLTLWLPIGDVPVEQGAMMVCRGSHRLRAFAPIHTCYGKSQVGKDGTVSGWFSDDGNDVGTVVANRYAVDWRTTDFEAGDAVALSLDVIHMTAANRTDQIRLSCDTRWQPAQDPRDPCIRDWHSCDSGD
uniref:Phytanoyl-CoA dioxygenase n=1 Tax=Pyramimonas obovata TaxID=1411642 RepID=A0A7S0QVB7_9CHLO|mmetsp:Transcript_22205/g.48748  ORF Transcript_22205/g.48748 Transcript_22205/m.48748 type:complete len:288 (+) Transcript_22205:257-1120(+)